jgi:hypothetical protein
MVASAVAAQADVLVALVEADLANRLFLIRI